MANPKLVTGLFKNRVAAEAAVDAILKRGYTRDDISVMMSDATHERSLRCRRERMRRTARASVGRSVAWWAQC